MVGDGRRGRLRIALVAGIVAEVVLLVAGAVLVLVVAIPRLVDRGDRRDQVGRVGQGRDAEPSGGPFQTVVRAGGYRLEVTISPARVGANNIQLTATEPDGGPTSVREWRLTLSGPGHSGDGDSVPVLPSGRDRAIAEVAIPRAGRWTLTVTLRWTDTEQDAAAVTVPIR